MTRPQLSTIQAEIEEVEHQLASIKADRPTTVWCWRPLDYPRFPTQRLQALLKDQGVDIPLPDLLVAPCRQIDGRDVLCFTFLPEAFTPGFGWSAIKVTPPNSYGETDEFEIRWINLSISAAFRLGLDEAST